MVLNLDTPTAKRQRRPMSNRLLIALSLGAALVAAPAAFAADSAPAPAAAAAVAFSADTPIETIVANAQGKAALDKVVPGLTAHPQFEAFKSLSLRQLQPYSEGKITDDVLKAIDAELAKIKG
jgi:uncharacterized iron-regulated protein